MQAERVYFDIHDELVPIRLVGTFSSFFELYFVLQHWVTCENNRNSIGIYETMNAAN